MSQRIGHPEEKVSAGPGDGLPVLPLLLPDCRPHQSPKRPSMLRFRDSRDTRRPFWKPRLLLGSAKVWAVLGPALWPGTCWRHGEALWCKAPEPSVNSLGLMLLEEWQAGAITPALAVSSLERGAGLPSVCVPGRAPHRVSSATDLSFRILL